MTSGHDGKVTASQAQSLIRRSKGDNKRQREDELDFLENQRAATHLVAGRDREQTDAAFRLPNSRLSDALAFELGQQNRAAIGPSLTTVDWIRQRAAGVSTESLQQLLDLSSVIRLAQAQSVADRLHPNQNLLASSMASPLVNLRWLQNQTMTAGLRHENLPAIPFLAEVHRLNLPLPSFPRNGATSALFQPSLDFQLASLALAQIQQPANLQQSANLQQMTQRHLLAEVASIPTLPQNCNVFATAANAHKSPQPHNSLSEVASASKSPQRSKAETSKSSRLKKPPQGYAAASLVPSSAAAIGKKPPKRRRKEAKESNAAADPMILYTPDDVGKLNEQQVFLRRQIEYFRATNDEIFSISRGKNRPIVLQQVGIRCLHCRHIPAGMRRKGSTYFPSTLMGIYRGAKLECRTLAKRVLSGSSSRDQRQVDKLGNEQTTICIWRWQEMLGGNGKNARLGRHGGRHLFCNRCKPTGQD